MIMLLPDGVNVTRWKPKQTSSIVDRVAAMTVAELREAVEQGDMDAAEVVAAEEQGKRRAGVMSLT